MASVGDTIQVNVSNPVSSGRPGTGIGPDGSMSVPGEIVEDLGSSWRVRLSISVRGKNTIVVPK